MGGRFVDAGRRAGGRVSAGPATSHEVPESGHHVAAGREVAARAVDENADLFFWGEGVALEKFEKVGRGLERLG